MNELVLVSVSILIYLLFIWRAGRVYPILYLFLFVYFIQYIFSVYLIYNEYPVLRKQMPIQQEQLFEFVLPALFFLFAGVFLFNKDIDLRELLKKITPFQAARLGNLLVVVSYFFEILEAVGVPGINSITSFTYYLKFIGGMCYVFSPSVLNYAILAFVYLDLIRTTLSQGIFVDFFVWSAYLFFIFCLRYRSSFLIRSAFIFLAIPVLVLIQSVKQDYRDATWSGKQQAGVESLSTLTRKNQKSDDNSFAQSDGVIKTVGRLNQGWHLGLVLRWVPKRQPFANGADFFGDIQGTLLPRVFFEDKKVIGGQDKFYKYTGHKLSTGTSMTIGILGDFFINFGRWGSFVGLFIFGAVVSKILSFFIRRHVLLDPINIIWIPFLFSYLVRANNDFYIVINSFVKGYLIFLAINFIRKQF